MYNENLSEQIETVKAELETLNNIDGIEIKDQKQIETETFRYWKKIYQKQNVTQEVSIHDFLNANSETLDKLNENEKRFCDEEISLVDI